VLVLGDMLELGDASAELHREVGAAAAAVHRATRFEAAILVGAFATHTLEGLASNGWSGASLVLPTLDAASIDAAMSLVRPNDALLLKGSRGAAMERLLEAMRGGERLAKSRGICR
jgi:UDP-N-acetylmuramoyl-tripeptide--D-alanyl-D-alanine ligase